MTNFEMVLLVAKKLGKLRSEVVFLGGAATGLLITDKAAPEPRITMDVDVIVEISSLSQYYKLGELLKKQGFSEDMTDNAPLCRWVVEGIKVDVMPTDEKVLGFSNRWYGPAISESRETRLAPGIHIRIVTAPFFLATKIEAFKGRGKNDFFGSHDMEDIITLIDGRTELLGEISDSSAELKKYLAASFNDFMRNPSFIQAIPGHLLPNSASQARIPLIMRSIKGIGALIGV